MEEKLKEGVDYKELDSSEIDIDKDLLQPIRIKQGHLIIKVFNGQIASRWNEPEFYYGNCKMDFTGFSSGKEESDITSENFLNVIRKNLVVKTFIDSAVKASKKIDGYFILFATEDCFGMHPQLNTKKEMDALEEQFKKDAAVRLKEFLEREANEKTTTA